MRAALALALTAALAGCKEQPPSPVAPSASATPTVSAAVSAAPSSKPPETTGPPAYAIARANRELLDELAGFMGAEPQADKLLDACKLKLASIDRIDAAIVPPAAVEVWIVGKVAAEAVTCLLDIVAPQIEPKVETSPDGVRVTTAGGAARALELLDAQPKEEAHFAARAGVRPAWRVEFTTRGDELGLALESTPAAIDGFHAWWQAAVAEKGAQVPALRSIGMTKKGGRLALSFEGEGWEDVETSTQRALAIRQHVAESFRVPSGSMLPTLAIGDHFFVDKTGRSAERGDVIVFPLPDNPTQQFVKRLVAGPGDRLEALDGRPIINGMLLPHCAVGELPLTEGGKPQPIYVEHLGEHRYLTAYDEAPTTRTCKQDADCASPDTCHADRCGRHAGPWRAKLGEAWVMGDNRDNSYDSRAFDGGRGSGIALGAVVGRAAYRYFHPTDLGRAFTSIEEVILDRADDATRARLARCLEQPPQKSDRTPPAP